MRVVSVSSLKGNEILGKQIYDEAGRVLLSAGVELKPYFIERIKELGIYSVYIEDDISRNVVIEETISEKTRQMSKHAVKEMTERYSREGKTDNSSVRNSVNSIIEDILSNKDVLINVSEISASDNNIYSHSVNVCVLSTIIGTHMGFSMLKLKDIAAGGMLHDIGKIKIINDSDLAIMVDVISDPEWLPYCKTCFDSRLQVCGKQTAEIVVLVALDIYVPPRNKQASL